MVGLTGKKIIICYAKTAAQQHTDTQVNEKIKHYSCNKLTQSNRMKRKKNKCNE